MILQITLLAVCIACAFKTNLIWIHKTQKFPWTQFLQRNISSNIRSSCMVCYSHHGLCPCGSMHRCCCCQMTSSKGSFLAHQNWEAAISLRPDQMNHESRHSLPLYSSSQTSRCTENVSRWEFKPRTFPAENWTHAGVTTRCLPPVHCGCHPGGLCEASLFIKRFNKWRLWEEEWQIYRFELVPWQSCIQSHSTVVQLCKITASAELGSPGQQRKKEREEDTVCVCVCTCLLFCICECVSASAICVDEM